MFKRSRVITMSPLVVNQEDDLEIDLDLWEVINPSEGEYSDDSFSVVSLSDDYAISLDDAFVSPSVLPPTPQILPGDDGGDLAADADLDLGDHVDGNGDVDHVDGNGDADHVDYNGDVDHVDGNDDVDHVDGNGDGDADHVSRDEIDDYDLGRAQQRMMFPGSRNLIGVAYGNYVNDDSDEDRGVEDDDYDDSYDLDDEFVLRNVNRKMGRHRMRKLGNRGIAKVSTSKKSPYSHLKPVCVRGKHGLGMKFKCGY